MIKKERKSAMKENQHKLDEENYLEDDSTATVKEKALILPMTKPKKNLEQAISSPEQYVSRYQYNIRNTFSFVRIV
jgi:hypothetical protein